MKKINLILITFCSFFHMTHTNFTDWFHTHVTDPIENNTLDPAQDFIAPDVADHQDTWKRPNKHLRYDQVHCVTAHNAFTYASKFKIYFQQIWNLEEQLNHGIRGLMLDTHWYDDDVCLAHGKTSGYHALQIGILSGLWGLIKDDIDYELFTDALTTIHHWLNKHPKEVVTIILENHTTNANIVNAIKRVPGLHDMVLTQNDWHHSHHNGHWPTLNWMRKHNKRLVFFCGELPDPQPELFYTWHYIMESDYSTTKPEKVCADERSPSRHFKHLNRHLVTINFFPKVQKDGIPLPFNDLHRSRKRNSYESLKNLLETCASLDFAHKKAPNFLALDFVNVGNPMKLINELNALEKAQLSKTNN